MFNPTLLSAALNDPTFTALSDADAATALSVPTYTPRPESITFATLGSVWGLTQAATFGAGLDAGAAGTDPAMAALCKLAIRVLTAGMNASDAQSQAAGQQFVAANLCTQDQYLSALFQPPTYRCGDVVQTSDVTTARAALARQATITALSQKVTAAYASFLNETVNPALSDPTKDVPTWAAFQSLVAGIS